jgi:hypothetical protein
MYVHVYTMWSGFQMVGWTVTWTYDCVTVSYIVPTTSYVRCYVRRWTCYVVSGCIIAGLTYDIVGPTYDVVCLGKCKVKIRPSLDLEVRSGGKEGSDVLLGNKLPREGPCRWHLWVGCRTSCGNQRVDTLDPTTSGTLPTFDIEGRTLDIVILRY